MAKIIKLENIVPVRYNRQTGEPSSEVTEEYVCEACRHLVKTIDKFCWQCGGELEQSTLIEHYSKGKKLTEEEYRRL